MGPRPRLAIVATHPIQYVAPWFAHLTSHLHAKTSVFYLWDFGAALRHDPGFGQTLRWDIDLLSDYEHRFVENQAQLPGTDHFCGLRNQSLVTDLHAWKPDAILLFGYRYWSHLRVISSRRLRAVPLLFRGDSHLLAEGNGLFSRVTKRICLRALFARFAAFLPVGQANTHYFRRHGVPVTKLFHTPHAVDQKRFDPASEETQGAARLWRRSLHIPVEHRVILFAGKFETKKKPGDLIEAFLSAKLSRVSLLLVGSGELEKQLRARAGNHPDIRFAPFQNQSAMPRVYAAADLVVLPSEGPGETWGLCLTEACSMGRAVVVSDHVGCHPDLVRPEENGLVFRAGEIMALRTALQRALGDDARLRRWGDASRKIAASFSYAHATAGLERALAFVLPEGAG